MTAAQEASQVGTFEVQSRGYLSFAFDADTDLLTIEGIRYSADLFRGLGFNGFRPNTILQIVERLDGVLTVKRLIALEGVGE